MCEVINLFILSLTRVASRALQQSFWEAYGQLILEIIIIALGVAACIVIFVYQFKKDRRDARMIEVNGKKVDPEVLVTVTMIGNTAETITKGEIFTAPLIEKEGYDFAGWYYDTAFTRPYYNRPIKTDITLYPKWVKHS